MKTIFHFNGTAYLTSAVKSARVRYPGDKYQERVRVRFIDGDALDVGSYWYKAKFDELCEMFELN